MSSPCTQSSPRTQTSQGPSEHIISYSPPTARTVEEEYLHTLGPRHDTKKERAHFTRETGESLPAKIIPPWERRYGPNLTTADESRMFDPKLYGRVEANPSHAAFKNYRRNDGKVEWRGGTYVSKGGGVKKSRRLSVVDRLYGNLDEHANRYEGVYLWEDFTNSVHNVNALAGPGALAELAAVLDQLDIGDTGGDEKVEGGSGGK